MLITERGYFDRIADIAECAVTNAFEQADNIEDARELVYDCLLHEAVDGSGIAIYNRYHLPVLYYTANDDAWEEFGDDAAAAALKEGGITQLHAYLAYCAIYADVNDIIEDALNEYPGGRRND
tara:strand:+ start:610 stop:978 length:369 start_codon:yes stop_codon:yes gene_type:complete